MTSVPSHIKFEAKEVFRFIVNGIFASAIHFGVLWFCLNSLGFESAGFSNLVASIFGIAASFFGNRYFVFRQHNDTILQQLLRFIGLYISIAIIHGLSSLVLTDIYGVDYRIGFIFALIIQIVLGYLGSKFLVFSK